MIRVYLVGPDEDELFAYVDKQDQADRLVAALYHARNDQVEAELLNGEHVRVVPGDMDVEIR